MTRFIVVVHDFDFHDFTISGIYADYERALERFFYEIGNEFAMAITLGCKKNLILLMETEKSTMIFILIF